MKRIISLLIAVLLVALMIPWAAATDYEYIHDETDRMDYDAMVILSETMRDIDESFGVKVLAEIVTTIDEDSLEAHFDQLQSQLSDENCILLTLRLAEQDGDLRFVDYSWRMNGYWATEEDIGPQMEAASTWFNEESFSQSIEIDREACVYGLNYYVGVVGSQLYSQGGAYENPDADSSLILSPDDSVTIPSGNYIFDAANLLTESERAKLEDLSAQITAEYPINVYVLTVDDYRDIHSGGVFEAAEQFYLSRGLGYGPNQDGMLLLLSMEDRDYSLIVYGDYATTNLTDYGRRQISEEFLDDFRKNDWAGGFTDYLTVTKAYLKEAKENRPVDNYPEEPPDPKKVRSLGAVISLIMSFPASLLACTGMKAKMRSVSAAHTANQYLNPGSVNFSDRSEVFTHTSQVRTPIPREEHRESGGGGSDFGGGGTHINSSGFGGHSGKF